MKSFLVTVGIIIAILLVLFGIAFASGHLDIWWQEYFGVRQAAVEREIFKATRSFNEAKVQELSKYRLEYLRSEDSTEKEAIASTIRHTFADYDYTKLDPDLRDFLRDIKSGGNP